MSAKKRTSATTTIRPWQDQMDLAQEIAEGQLVETPTIAVLKRALDLGLAELQGQLQPAPKKKSKK